MSAAEHGLVYAHAALATGGEKPLRRMGWIRGIKQGFPQAESGFYGMQWEMS